MIRLIITLVLALYLTVTAAGPADGNGKKMVFNISDLGIPEDCNFDGAPDLSLDIVGWIQGKAFDGDGNRNLELTVFHLDGIYTNATGEMWTWRDRGPDRLYFIDDEAGPQLVIAISGRAGLNIIGRIVVNLITGETIFEAGRHPFGGELFEFTPDDAACEILS